MRQKSLACYEGGRGCWRLHMKATTAGNNDQRTKLNVAIILKGIANEFEQLTLNMPIYGVRMKLGN